MIVEGEGDHWTWDGWQRTTPSLDEKMAQRRFRNTRLALFTTTALREIKAFLRYMTFYMGHIPNVLSQSTQKMT